MSHQKHDTFCKLLVRNAEVYAHVPAMREKYLGIWQVWTWAQVLDEVIALSLGYKEFGVKEGDLIAIIGNNRPRLYWTMCAAQALGAIPVPLYQDAVAEEMRIILEKAGVTYVVAEDQEQADKVLQIQGSYKEIAHIFYDEKRGLEKYPIEGLTSLDEVQERGRSLQNEDESARQKWLNDVSKGAPKSVAIILYTSGTTGASKGVVLTVASLMWGARVGNKLSEMTEKDTVMAFLPMAWVGDHIFSYAQSLEAGFCVNCPESPETALADRREVGPTCFFAPPRIYENLITLTLVRMHDAGQVKRLLFNFFLDVAQRVGGNVLNNETVRFIDRLLYMMGKIIIYTPLKNRYGFSRLRVAYTAGEAIGPDIFNWFRALGINLKQFYGQTEASVYVSMQPDGEIYSDSVGKPVEGVEVMLNESGELLYRSPGAFKEYYNNPQTTSVAKTEEGWIHSGDAALFDGRGHLRIMDRAKDLGLLNDGKVFPPKYIENKLKYYPEIKEAVAFGHHRDYVTVMINIDLLAVGSWAERHNVHYSSYQELAANPDVYAMILRCVNLVNKDLATDYFTSHLQIKRFLILHKELDADDGELTHTSKVRRSLINERYKVLIDALYDPSKTHQFIRVEMTYEDGRKGIAEGDLALWDVEVT